MDVDAGGSETGADVCAWTVTAASMDAVTTPLSKTDLVRCMVFSVLRD
jgi:hypothetical protein